MRLSRSATIRFALERTVVGIAENWLAIVTVVGIGFLGILGGYFLYSGPTQTESAEVVGFGIYENEIGTHPIVRVRLADGGIAEVASTTSIVRACRAGSRIWLLRRRHSLAVDPAGCSPRPI
jgi:hypothetical protein